MNKKIKYLKKLMKKNNYKYQDEIIKFIETGFYLFKEDFLVDILIYLVENNLPTINLEYAKELYNIIIYKNDENEKKLFFKFYPLFIKYREKEYTSILKILYNLFNDKKLVYYIYKELDKVKGKIIFKIICDYIITSKKYYIDENANYFSIIKFINEVYLMDNEKEVTSIMNEYLQIDEQISGIYRTNYSKRKEVNSRKNNLVEKLKIINKKLLDLKISYNLLEEHSKVIEKIYIKKEISNIYLKTKELIKEYKNKKEKQDYSALNKKLDIIIKEISTLNEKNVKEENKKVELIELLGSIKKHLRPFIKEYKEEIDNKFINILEDLFSKYGKEKVLNNLSLENNICNNYNFLEIYYYALCNNTVNILSKINFNNIRLSFLKKELNNVLNESVCVYLINNNPNFLLRILKLEDKKNLNIINEIFKINPEFKWNLDVNYFIKSIEVFGVRTIAKNDKILEENIGKSSLDELNILKEIYIKNPKYKIFYNSFLSYVLNYFSIDEILTFDKEKQKWARDLIFRGYTTDGVNIIKKFILSETKAEFSYNLPRILLKFNISIDEYISLSKEKSKILIDTDKTSENGNKGLGKREAKKVLKKIGVSHEEKK